MTKNINSFFSLDIKINSLELTNFRGITSLNLALDPNLTVIIGDNGAGKTTILDAAANLLKKWVGVITGKEQSENIIFHQSDIKNDEQNLHVGLEVFYNLNISEDFFEYSDSYDESLDDEPNQIFNTTYSVSNISFGLGLTRGDTAFQEDEFTDDDAIFATKFTEARRYLSDAVVKKAAINLPILAYYSSVRNSSNFDSFIQKNNTDRFELLTTYDNALTGEAFNFATFYRWFEWQYNKSGHNIENNRLLKVVCDSIYSVLSYGDAQYSNLSINYDLPNGELCIEKAGQILRVNQFSSGEKSIFALVADLARRLAIANPEATEPLKGSGIVLVDEIDLHLHPRWQRALMPALSETFPNIQWVVTTHSPLLLGQVHKQNIAILNNGIVNQPNEETFGKDLNRLLQIFTVSKYPQDIQDKITNMFRYLELEKIAEAKPIYDELREMWGDNDAVVLEAEVLFDYYNDSHEVNS
jgi:predicted ATP-binding protein involved in virulence